MAEAAKVRVGVRVRPLLPRELAQDVAQVISHPSEKQVLVDGNEAHRFTYDHVFPMHASQRDLYASTAAQMLQPFLDGYNVTILAYGQTGSGKTYTMGSECGTTDKYDDERRGLIPRFLYDMFMNLNADVSHRLEANAMASFLEIYGEDVYDLLSDGVAPGTKRPSLQVLEDKAGVFVNGLTQVPVLGWEAALDVLSQGVLNRTTASTLMNTVSSRSHAVFTITLTQTIKDDTEPDGDPQTVTSKLTFVDLAGSERLSRTGAEGQRKREGIQINQGLLALGNVVNALGDDRQEKKNVYVPYRQSKLTRLLQDALGGNSQTLFIACVSPAADSINETVAALHYANRARNIKNKVVKNTDGAKEELRRLRSTAAALQMELVWEHFHLGAGGPNAQGPEKGDPEATGHGAGLGHGPDLQPEEVLSRDDVKAYLKTVQSRVAEQVSKRQTSSLPLLLTTPGLTADPTGGGSANTPFGNGSRSAISRRILRDNSCGGTGVDGSVDYSVEFDMAGKHCGDGDGDANDSGGSAVERDELEHDPEEELAVLDQLIEWQRQTGEYGDAAKEEEKRLEETDSQIREKESMLLKVRETLQGYHHMRERFDTLVCKIGELEKEKISLIGTIKNAAASNSNSDGCRGGKRGGDHSKDPAVTEAVKERLKGVESQLAALGAQKKKQERAVMLLQRESKKCEELQEGLAQLKRQKVVLLKRQQEAAKRHREYELRMSREIQAMRKQTNRDHRHMSKMELEVRRQKAAADRKSVQVGRMGDKLKKTEEHLLRLLALRKQQGVADRARARRGGRRGGGASVRAGKGRSEKSSAPATTESSSASEARVAAAKHLLDQAVSSRVEHAALSAAFAEKIRAYDEATSLQVSNIAMLRDHRAQLRDLKATANKSGRENVDPGCRRVGGCFGEEQGPGPNGRKASQVSVGEVDNMEDQRVVVEEFIQETEKAIDETQEKLEMLGVELDDMCRRLGMGDSFQGRSGVVTDKGGRLGSPGRVGSAGDKGPDVPGSPGSCSGFGPRELKALEGLSPVEARQLMTSLVDDITAAGIGEMVLKEEASKQAAEMVELREKNKALKNDLFRLSQRYSRRMSMMKVDHTRDMMRLSMLDSCGDSVEDSSSSGFGSISGHLPEENPDQGEDGAVGGRVRREGGRVVAWADAPPQTPSNVIEVSADEDRGDGLGPVVTHLFASPLPRRVNSRASWGGQRSPRLGIPSNSRVTSPISSRDACEASANRRLSGQQLECVLARQRQLEGSAEADRKRLEKVVERNRALTQDLQRERAERQRVHTRLVAIENGVEGASAESLRDAMVELENLWVELGVTQDQRLNLVDRVSSGVLNEARQQLAQARDERVSLGAKLGSLREDVGALWDMLGKGSEEEEAVVKSLEGKPLRVQAEQLSSIVLTAGEEVCSGAVRRAKLRTAAIAAVRVLELADKDIGPELATLLHQSRFKLPRALQDDEDMVTLSQGSLEAGLNHPDVIANEQAQELSYEGKCGDGGEELPVYLVGAEMLATFEGEVRKLRTMQAEAHAGYHEVREAAREAVLSMDLSAEEAFDIAKKAFYGGLVELGEGAGSNEQALDENALDYACSLLCRPGTTHVHVSRSRTQHLEMAWAAVKLAQEDRNDAIKSAKILVTRAHREFAIATSPSTKDQRGSLSPKSPPPALEAFLEGLSEDLSPLSEGVLKTFEGELLRIRDESLAALEDARKGIEVSRSVLREAGGNAAMGRASDPPLPPSSSFEDGGVGSSLAAIERLSIICGGARVEEWLEQASSSIVGAWGAVRQALGSLAEDKALAQALAKSVSALEGVQSTDQDICQLAQRMAELQSALDPARLSKRNKSSTHLLEAEKNRNACQAAYIRSLKRLKEQFKNWREVTGCGFDPSLLSDVAREALLDFQRSGKTGAKIEHILPHVSVAGGSGGRVSRSGIPEMSSNGPKVSSRVTGGASGGGISSSTPARQQIHYRSASPDMDSSPETAAELSGGLGAAASGASVGPSAAEREAEAMYYSGNRRGGGDQLFRRRGGAFGMLLNKVQTSHGGIMPPSQRSGGMRSADGGGMPKLDEDFL